MRPVQGRTIHPVDRDLIMRGRILEEEICRARHEVKRRRPLERAMTLTIELTLVGPYVVTHSS